MKIYILIFYDVMHRKKIIPWYINMFIFHNSARTGKTFTLKFIMQGLLWLYNRSIYFNLTKTKVLFMASTSKVAFNVDSLTIH